MNRSTPPPVYPFGRLSIPPIATKRLRNGITLHYYSGGTEPVSTLTLLFAGGESEFGNDSISRITLNALADGAECYPEGEIARLLDFNGARLAGTCHGHYSSLRLSMLNSRAEALLPVFGDMIMRPALPQRRLDIAVSANRERIATALSNTAAQADELFTPLIAGKTHPFAQTTDPAVLDKAGREDFVETHRKLVCPRRMHAFLAGKLDDSLLAAVERTLEGIEPLSEGLEEQIIPFAAEAPGTTVTKELASLQSAIMTGMPTIGRDNPDYIPLRLTVMALGGYFGSRLMTTIREEKGLTYGITAALIGSQEGAYLKISAQCDKSFTAAVLDETRNELRRLVTDPPRGEELQRLKLHAQSALAEMLDTPQSIATYYITELLVNTPTNYYDMQQDSIDAFSPDKCAALAEKYLNPDRLLTAIAGAS